MVRREKVAALVLSRRNFGEADRLVTLFTKEHGLMKVMAKGVRTVPSRRGGHIEPFTEVLAIVSGGPGHYFLAAVETQEYYHNLHNDQDALLRAHLLTKVLLGLFEEEDKQEKLFVAMRDGWEMLSGQSENKRTLLEVALYLMMLRLAGLMPQLDNCQQCGGGAEEGTAVVLDERVGGWVCLTCRASLVSAANSITINSLKAIKYLAKYPERTLGLVMSETEAEQLLKAVRQYVNGVVAWQIGHASVGELR